MAQVYVKAPLIVQLEKPKKMAIKYHAFKLHNISLCQICPDSIRQNCINYIRSVRIIPVRKAVNMNENILIWDIAQSAPLHSQLTGVLAGFVFTSILLLLSNPPDKSRVAGISRSLNTLYVVFITLVVSSFLYAFCAADGSAVGGTPSERMWILMTLACFVFAISGVYLFYSIAWLMHDYGIDLQVAKFVSYGFYGVTVVALLYLVRTVSYEAYIIKASIGHWTPFTRWVPVLSDLIFLIVMLAPWLILLIKKYLPVASLNNRVYSEFTAFILTVIIAIYSFVIVSIPHSSSVKLFPLLIQLLLSLCFGIFIVSTAMSLPQQAISQRDASRIADVTDSVV